MKSMPVLVVRFEGLEIGGTDGGILHVQEPTAVGGRAHAPPDPFRHALPITCRKVDPDVVRPPTILRHVSPVRGVAPAYAPAPDVGDVDTWHVLVRQPDEGARIHVVDGRVGEAPVGVCLHHLS